MKTDMVNEKWHERWEQGKLGFHQTRYNSRLEKYWPELNVSKEGAVFVPLCGKSLDMLLLHEMGYQVVGVELSEIAVEAFFSENQLTFKRTESGNLQEFTGTGKAAGIRLFAGDLFDLDTAKTGPLSGFYDRASLIALPPEIRQQYVAKLADLLSHGALGLLISLSYDPSSMSGPPFSVPDSEVQSHFGDHFSVDYLEQYSGPERLGSLADRGLETMEEFVYRIERI